MIRRDAEENLKRDKGQQTAEDTAGSAPAKATTQQFDDDEEEEKMEVDEGGEWGGEPMDDDDDHHHHHQHSSPAVGQLLQEALEYGQELRAEFADNGGADPEMSRQLDEIFALIAYQNPLKEEGVKHLLDRSGRVAVAEELNSAILRESFPTLLFVTTVKMLTKRGNKSPWASHPARRWRRCTRRRWCCSSSCARTAATAPSWRSRTSWTG